MKEQLAVYFKSKHGASLLLYQLNLKKRVLLEYKKTKFAITKPLNLTYLIGWLYNIYDNRFYDNVDVEGKVVIDLGATYGEAAVYFAQRGAAHVYAIEAYSGLASLIEENAKLNGLSDRITVINRCIAYDRKSVLLDRYPPVTSVIVPARNEKQKFRIKATTLKKIIGMVRRKGPLVLKSNLDRRWDEGILANDASLLGRFDQIIMKPHGTKAKSLLLKELHGRGSVREIGDYVVFKKG